MERIKADTMAVVVPSGYTVTIKKRLTYGEQQRIINEVMGDMPIDGAQPELKMTFAQANNRAPITVLHHIESWDITDNGESVPVTLQNINDCLFGEDIDMLIGVIDGLKEDPKKEIGS